MCTSRLEVSTWLSAAFFCSFSSVSCFHCILLYLIQTCFTEATSDSKQHSGRMRCRAVSSFICGSTETRMPGPQAPGRAFLTVTVVLSAGSQDAETSGMASVLRPPLPFIPQFDFRIQTFILKSLPLLLLNAICLKRL